VLVVSIMDLLDCRLMCFGVFQAVIGNQQARDNLAQVPSTSHLPWHVHLPSNETYDAQVCVYTVSQKRSHCNLAHNFAICWPISKFVHWHILCNFSYGILKLEKKNYATFTKHQQQALPGSSLGPLSQKLLVISCWNFAWLHLDVWPTPWANFIKFWDVRAGKRQKICWIDTECV